MVELIIDGRRAQCDPRRRFEISLYAPGSWDAQGRQIKVSLPIDRRNTEAVGDVVQVLSRDKFNSQVHEGRIEVDGCVLMRGQVDLENIERDPDGGGWYNMVLSQQRPGWAVQAAQRMFREIPVEFECVQGIESLIESWTWEKPVRFLPVQRRKDMVRNDSGTAIRPSVVLTPEDYHPFLHVATLLRAIMQGAGYTLVSRFASSPMFDSLYMSGCYPEQGTDALKRRLDFRAGRFADSSTTVDPNGKVGTSPYTTLSSVGNIVETAEPGDMRGGEAVPGVYNPGGAFRMDGQRVAFIPQSEVQVGFEYYIAYRTEYRILSRGELAGVNSVIFGDGIEHSFGLVNRFEDKRENFLGGMNYRFVSFDHVEGTTYMIRYDEVVNPDADLENLLPSDVRTVTVPMSSARSQSITVSSTRPVRNMVLSARLPGAGAYSAYSGDWALYEGHVTETGTTDVEITLRSAPGRATPSSPAYFDNIVFRGGIPGSTFTLLKSTYLRPVFSANPAMGATVGFADVAAHGVRQSEFVEALAHVFNLRFYTDEHSRQVFAEPYGEFWNDGAVDWSRLTDRSRGMEITEPGAEMSRVTTLCYRAGDDATAMWDEDNFTHTGRMSFHIANRLASSREKVVENTMFTPTLSLKGGYPDAPDAWFMQAGERNAYPSQGDDSLNFPAKIVRYAGLSTLPEGQLWGWPLYMNRYPLAAFHLPEEEGFTLCFEDRDGMTGLHTLHDPFYRSIDRGRRITVWLRLGPVHIEALQDPSTLGHDMRRTFLIGVGGEKIACRMESVEDFDPFSNEPVKCTFLTI